MAGRTAPFSWPQIWMTDLSFVRATDCPSVRHRRISKRLEFRLSCTATSQVIQRPWTGRRRRPARLLPNSAHWPKQPRAETTQGASNEVVFSFYQIYRQARFGSNSAAEPTGFRWEDPEDVEALASGIFINLTTNIVKRLHSKGVGAGGVIAAKFIRIAHFSAMMLVNGGGEVPPIWIDTIWPVAAVLLGLRGYCRSRRCGRGLRPHRLSTSEL